MFSSLPKYHTFGHNSFTRSTSASHPNIRKKELSLECSFGKKLHVVHANGTTLSHSSVADMCFAIQAFQEVMKTFYLSIGLGSVGW